MARTLPAPNGEFMQREIGGVRLTLRAILPPKPDVDPGYDLPDMLFEVEVWSEWDWQEHVYADYESARARYDREVIYQAVLVAKRAMRRAA